MAFPFRKLLDDSGEDSVQKKCLSYCDPIKNPTGACPDVCMDNCFPVCNHPLYSEIPPPPPGYASLSGIGSRPSKTLGLSIFLSISLAILATAFFAFCCYSAYKFYRKRNNSRSRELASQPPSQPPREEEARVQFLDEDQGLVVDHPIWYIRTVGLQPSVISAITVCKYKRSDGLVEGTDCSVCLNEFQDGETLRLLPKCNHAFHIPCIDTWLASHTNCPNCRAGIVMSTPNFQSISQTPQNSGLNSGRLEESQVEVSGNNINWESERERESEVLEVSIDMEDEEESRINESSIEDDEGGSGSSREGEGIQPMRRSVSLDTLSASVVNAAIANAFSAQSEREKDKNFTEINGLNVGRSAPKGAGNDQSGSSSTERSLQKETSLVKRSLSCSAKVFLSRYGKSRNSSLLP